MARFLITFSRISKDSIQIQIEAPNSAVAKYLAEQQKVELIERAERLGNSWYTFPSDELVITGAERIKD